MPIVHLFISTGRFAVFEEMRGFIDPEHTDDGDLLPSIFMKEIQLRGYEPACIEAEWVPHPCPLSELLREASYAHQWLSHVDPFLSASEAVCVFEPNIPGRPEGTSLIYCGSYVYDPHRTEDD